VVAGKPAANDWLFATTWVHVFEEDTAKGAVYRPEDDDIPLSRRPRQRIKLRADGSASVSVPTADDRYMEEPAAWSEEKGAVVIHGRSGTPGLRIVDRSPSRLIVESEKR
jgi:hypothetical protein